MEEQNEEKPRNRAKELLDRFPTSEIDGALTFEGFLELFPEVELPVSFTSETQRQIAQHQKPMNEAWALEFLLEKDFILDEFTEFMPCFRLPITEFHAIVYWEAALLGNEFQLVTFSKSGAPIDRCVLAGTKYEENELVQTVCTIRKDWTISQIQGRVDAHQPSKTSLNRDDQAILQITIEGEIVEL